MCLPALDILRNWSQCLLDPPPPPVEIVESLVLRTVPLWLKALPHVRFTLGGQVLLWLAGKLFCDGSMGSGLGLELVMPSFCNDTGI